MKFQRNENYMDLSPSVKPRNQQRIESDHSRFLSSLRGSARGGRSPSARRSLSPLDQARSTRDMIGSQSSRSAGRREHHMPLAGDRSDRVPSRSLQYGKMVNSSHSNEGVMLMHMQHEYVDPMDFDGDEYSRLKHTSNYDHGFRRISKEKDCSENRFLGKDGNAFLGQKSISMEEGSIRRSYQLSQETGSNSYYGQTGGHVPSSLQSLDIGNVEHERLQYLEPLPLDKEVMMESCRKRDKHMNSSRNVSYTMVPSSHPRTSTSQYNDFVRTSSGISRDGGLVSYRDGVKFSVSEEHSRDIETVVGSVGFNYGQRPLVDSARDPEISRRNMGLHQQANYSPTRSEHEDYYYIEPKDIVKDDHAQGSGGFHRMVHSQTHIDHNHASVGYECGVFSRPRIMHAVNERSIGINDPHESTRDDSMLDYPTLQKQTASDYHNIHRPYQLKPNGGYIDSECTNAEYRLNSVRRSELSYLDVPQESKTLRQRSDFGFSTEAGPEYQKEVSHSYPVYLDQSETCGPALKQQKLKEEQRDLYGPSGKTPKRKYTVEQDMTRPSYKTKMASKWNVTKELGDLYDNELTDEDMFVSISSKSERFDNNDYERTERTYNRKQFRNPNERLPSHNYLQSGKRELVRNYEQGVYNVNGHSRPGSFSWRSSHSTDTRSTDKRNVLQKQQHKVWKRNHGTDDGVCDIAVSDDRVKLTESERSEESEQFKQLIHEAFLKYSKLLNVNLGVQQRYKEQGNAGSLWCIVCGRSVSKEFMDTQRLVTHAYMSHKVGLRAQHLGLHKAICVLLGWNTVVPPNTITWVPDVLPDAEALDEKEDLILWPPVVLIHNISMSNNNPEDQIVLPIERIEAFLRGNGVTGGKISLGVPSDQSIMVVKFLGTFSGLAMAERLHKYFTEKKHDRKGFRLITSNDNKLDISAEAVGQEDDEIEEHHLLYGYMGISEDLDRVDFNTKKWCVIKSKRDIQEVADAPVKADDK